jgi:hypothetical protein
VLYFVNNCNKITYIGNWKHPPQSKYMMPLSPLIRNLFHGRPLLVLSLWFVMINPGDCAGNITPIQNGDIIISELMATQSERLLRYPDSGEIDGHPVLPADWTLPSFDDVSWNQGPGGLGYGGGDDATDLQAELFGKASSLYIRRRFDITAADLANPNPLQLTIDDDDSFVAYLNGVEVARSNLGVSGSFIPHHRLADEIDLASAAGSALKTFDLGTASSLLEGNGNVLAIQVHNSNQRSAGLSIIADLKITGNPETTLVTSGETWTYFVGTQEPSPMPFTADPPTLGWGTPWHDIHFDDASWGAPVQDLGTLSGPTLYMRQAFPASQQQASITDRLEFGASYSGGFIAYLNGKEIARRNAGSPGGFYYHDSPAEGAYQSNGLEIWRLDAASGLLEEGTNVLAVQLHQDEADSASPFSFLACLLIGSDPVELLVPLNGFWKTKTGTTEPSGVLYDEAGADSDWVELCNTGLSGTNLAGWSLSDDPDVPDKYVFPDVTLDAGGYLVVFASGKTTTGPQLHVGFSLSGNGESLALYDNSTPRQLMFGWSGNYPPMNPFHSWGVSPSEGTYCYHDAPSPGQPNTGGNTFAGFVEAPDFSHPRGIYHGSVSLSLSSPTPGSIIRFTADGREPTRIVGQDYTESLMITQTVAIRARAFKDGYIPSGTTTHTYLMNLNPELETIPAISFSSDENLNLFESHGTAAIVGGYYRPGDFGDFWWESNGPDNHNNNIRNGRIVERPLSMEWLEYHDNAVNALNQQADCGVRVAGSAWRRGHYTRGENWLYNAENKVSFRLHFRTDYGPANFEFPLFENSRIDQFSQVVVRAGHNDTRNPFISDELARLLSHDMGMVASHGTFANLFVNGVYRGIYNPVESLREDFFREWHHRDSDWEIIHIGELKSGTADRWLELFTLLTTLDLSHYAAYQVIESRLDLVNFADYMLLNMYVTPTDWPANNWTAAREVTDAAKFRFYIWDAERGWGDFGQTPVSQHALANLFTSSDEIPTIFQALYNSPEFRLLFADRVQKHFTPGEALDASNIIARHNELREIVRPVIELLYGPFDNRIIEGWVPFRKDFLFEDLLETALFPTVLPPAFRQLGGVVQPGYEVELMNPNPAGEIYYTIDGTDPRVPGTGDILPSATMYTAPVPLASSVRFKTRVTSGSTWSVLKDINFLVQHEPGDVIITEFFADAPGADDNQEWFELFNTTNNPIDLSGWQIADNDSDLHLVSPDSSLIISPRSHVVMGQTDTGTLNCNAPVDYAYGTDVILGNDTDELILLQNGIVIHSLGYGNFDEDDFLVYSVPNVPILKNESTGMAGDYWNGPALAWSNQVSGFGICLGLGTPGLVNDGVVFNTIEDTTPPQPMTAKFARRNWILVQFDEGIPADTLTNPSNYSILNGAGPADELEFISLNSVLLKYDLPLAADFAWQLEVGGMSDLNGNTMTGPLTLIAQFSIPPVVINEIMYDNRGEDIEWVEILNTTPGVIDISGWLFTDDESYPPVGEGQSTLPGGTALAPGEYVVVDLWSSLNLSTWQFPPSIRVITTLTLDPGKLANGGDNLALYDAVVGGTLIDGSLDTGYPDLSPDGESIDKIDELFPWGDRDTIQFNMRRSIIPIRFLTGLNMDNELLSDFATPGQSNNPRNAVGNSWIIYP